MSNSINQTTKKERMVYFNVQKNMVRLELLRLNINDYHNLPVGNVNVADQLRNLKYCFI